MADLSAGRGVPSAKQARRRRRGSRCGQSQCLRSVSAPSHKESRQASDARGRQRPAARRPPEGCRARHTRRREHLAGPDGGQRLPVEWCCLCRYADSSYCCGKRYFSARQHHRYTACVLHYARGKPRCGIRPFCRVSFGMEIALLVLFWIVALVIVSALLWRSSHTMTATGIGLSLILGGVLGTCGTGCSAGGWWISFSSISAHTSGPHSTWPTVQLSSAQGYWYLKFCLRKLRLLRSLLKAAILPFLTLITVH